MLYLCNWWRNTAVRWQVAIHLALVLGLSVSVSDVVAGAELQSGPIAIVENTAEQIFAQQVTFTLAFTTEFEVEDVFLFFQASGDDHTESKDVDFEQQENTVRVVHVHDQRLYRLPPFATVTYWWRIEYGGGQVWSTEPQQFEHTDNRFQWRDVGDEENHVTIYWSEGDAAFAQSALDIARASLEDINAELRAPLPDSISLYIYDTQQNLAQAMMMAGRDWVGGQAHPELGVVVVAIRSDDFYSSRMDRYIPHELTHLLVYQAVGAENYRYVPEWLDEGLATANERLPSTDYALLLEDARVQGQFIPLEDLCVPFSPDAQTARLSYAQSGSVVRYIRTQYGAQGVRDLLAAYANGASCTSGVAEALGISLDELQAAWQASLEPEPQDQSALEAAVTKIGVWVALWALGLLVALPMLGQLRRRGQKKH